MRVHASRRVTSCHPCARETLNSPPHPLTLPREKVSIIRFARCVSRASPSLPRPSRLGSSSRGLFSSFICPSFPLFTGLPENNFMQTHEGFLLWIYFVSSCDGVLDDTRMGSNVNSGGGDGYQVVLGTWIVYPDVYSEPQIRMTNGRGVVVPTGLSIFSRTSRKFIEIPSPRRN